jgi:hypothetical protein
MATDTWPMSDTPMRLADAVAVAFPHGGMTAAGLRREAQRGRLAIERIAGKDFVTLSAINEMRARCLIPAKEPASILSRPTESNGPCGSSETERADKAHDALLATLEALRIPLRLGRRKVCAVAR